MTLPNSRPCRFVRSSKPSRHLRAPQSALGGQASRNLAEASLPAPPHKVGLVHILEAVEVDPGWASENPSGRSDVVASSRRPQAAHRRVGQSVGSTGQDRGHEIAVPCHRQHQNILRLACPGLRFEVVAVVAPDVPGFRSGADCHAGIAHSGSACRAATSAARYIACSSPRWRNVTASASASEIASAYGISWYFPSPSRHVRAQAPFSA
jgi:hypothetical protein